MSKILGAFSSIATEAGGLPEIDKQSVAYIAKANAGKRLVMTLTIEEKGRSTQQNKYYWGIVLPYYLYGLVEAGHFREGDVSEEDLHEEFKRRKLKHFAKRKRDKITKKYFINVPSTTKLTTWQFIDYLDSIIQDAAEYLNMVIPAPDKEWRDKAELDYQKALKAGKITDTERNRIQIALLAQNL